MPNMPDPQIKFGLERIDALTKYLDIDINNMPPTVHVAGTNGKGSTLCMLDNMLRHVLPDINILRYISPHLRHPRERYIHNGICISTEIFESLQTKIEKTDQKYNIQATFFEKMTAMAYLYAKEIQPDILLLETGLGGRYDATNICKPVLSIITTIGIDHTEYLGNTIEKIAYEKAGIIKTHYMHQLDGTAATTIEEYANSINAYRVSTKPTDIDISPSYQTMNAQLAMNACIWLGQKLWDKDICPSKLIPIAQSTIWEGRWDIRPYKDKNIILDGCHNAESMQAFWENIKKEYKNEKKLILFGLLKTKDLKEICHIIGQYISNNDTIICTHATSPDLSHPPEQIAHTLKAHCNNTICKDNIQDAIAYIKTQIAEYDIACIIGSLYMIGNVLADDLL